MISDMYFGVHNAIIIILVAIVPKRIFVILRKYPRLNV